MVPAAGGVIQQGAHLPPGPPHSLVDYLALSRLLIAPGASVMALAPDGRNSGDHLGTGELDVLAVIYPGAALLGRIRPDLVAVDFDGTAEFLADVDAAAEAVGAVRVYLALSGSPESCHAIYAPLTAAGRGALVEAVGLVDIVAGGGVDARTSAEWLRLPGAPSLKAGCGVVTPVNDLGAALAPAEALAAAEAGLAVRVADRAALAIPFDVTEFVPNVGEASDPVLWGNLPKNARVRDFVMEMSERPGEVRALDLDQRAWDALGEPCSDSSDTDRTLHALRAAWHIYRCGGRVWEDVAGVVMSSAALARWRRGGPGEAQRRWEMEAVKWSAWSPSLESGAATVLSEAHAAARALPADLEAVLLAILGRMASRGTVEDVPIAERDLVVWGVAGSRRTSGRALEALEAGGVLRCARRWEDGPLEEATLWTLNPAALWQVPGLEINSAGICAIDTHPPLGALTLHPLWLSLGHTSRRLLEFVVTSPDSSTGKLAGLLGLGASTVRGYLVRLEDTGLVRRSRSSRSTTWMATLDGWGSLPAMMDAEDGLAERRRIVAGERRAWHDLVNWSAEDSADGAELSPAQAANCGNGLFDVVPMAGSDGSRAAVRAPGLGDLVLSGPSAPPPG